MFKLEQGRLVSWGTLQALIGDSHAGHELLRRLKTADGSRERGRGSARPDRTLLLDRDCPAPLLQVHGALMLRKKTLHW